MKYLKILTVLFSILLFNLNYAEEAPSSLPVTPIQELKNADLNFDQLPTESVVGSLAEHVEEEESFVDHFLERIKTKRLLYPSSEGLVYLNGVLCHVGNYPRSIVYTVLEGPHYGLQTVQAYDGVILYVNHEHKLEYIPGGVILTHYYSDSKIITGSTQVISFY